MTGPGVGVGRAYASALDPQMDWPGMGEELGLEATAGGLQGSISGTHSTQTSHTRPLHTSFSTSTQKGPVWEC